MCGVADPNLGPLRPCCQEREIVPRNSPEYTQLWGAALKARADARGWGPSQLAAHIRIEGAHGRSLASKWLHGKQIAQEPYASRLRAIWPDLYDNPESGARTPQAVRSDFDRGMETAFDAVAAALAALRGQWGLGVGDQAAGADLERIDLVRGARARRAQAKKRRGSKGGPA